MTHLKIILLTAALVAAPSIAFAQSSATSAKDYATDKAVDTVLENATGEDAVVAGTTILKGGSQTDAAVAVVKNRANGQLENVTGGVGVNDLSTDGVVDAAKGSATTYATDKAKNSAATYAGTPAAGTAVETAAGSAKTYTQGTAVIDKAQGSATTYGATTPAPASSATTYTPSSTSSTLPSISCPSGTKDAGNGTCMVTGNWNPS